MDAQTQRHKQLLDVFSLFDDTQKGSIKSDDLPELLRAIGLGSQHLTPDLVESMGSAMDPKRSGRIQFDDFERVVKPWLVEPGSFEEQWAMFRLFDKDRKGFVDVNDLVQVGNIDCQGLLSEEQCKFVVTMLKPGTHAKGITFEEWKRAIGNVAVLQSITCDESRVFRSEESMVA